MLDKSLDKKAILRIKAGDHDAALIKVVEEHDPCSYGGRVVIAMPMRRAVMERDGGLCQSCNSISHIHLDHITPVSKGGKNVLRNLQVLCRTCNLIKADHLMTLQNIRERRVQLGYPAQEAPQKVSVVQATRLADSARKT